MIAEWKAELRAWLLQLMREAIREDRMEQERIAETLRRIEIRQVASVKPVPRPSTTFEAMRDAAISKCEVNDGNEED